MAAHNPTPSESAPLSDDDIGLLIRHTIDGESPRDAFVSSLADQLEAEFLSVLPSDTNAQADKPAREISTGSKPQTRHRAGRSLFALATAAIAVVAAVIWVSQPSYSWASMLQAMENQPWIESESGSPLDGSTSQSMEQSLLALLLTSTGVTTSDGKRSDRISVVSQSWESVGQGTRRWIELNVILRLGDRQPPTVQLVMHLDPKTHLPQECRIVSDEVQLAETFVFAYRRSAPVQRTVVSPLPENRDDEVLTAMVDKPTDSNSRIPDSGTKSADVTPIPMPVAMSANEMSSQVDRLMTAYWTTNGITPTASSEDDEFFRRVYLDLTGRIPTVSEYREFHADTQTDRRQRLIDQLLARRDHATHLGAVWRKILLPDSVDLAAYGGAASFEEWLSDRFRNNRSYDQIVRDLLLAEGRVSESGPLLFYAALSLKPEEIAARTSRAFLGIRLECAQCHDHFFDKRLKQTDFWGLAAFFAQISQPVGKMDTVSPVLRVADTDHGEVTLPDSEDIIAPQFPLVGSLTEPSDATSRREQLAAWITATDNPHFARATVNRVWAHLFGQGLVEPVDDMRIDNPSLYPEVLDELAAYFVATDFDLRNLFRVLVSSETYQRTSQSSGSDLSQTTHFAQMNIKTFTAEQLYDSISVATRLEPMEATDGSLMRFQNFGRQAFLTQFRAPPGQATDYQAGIPQALTLMNGRLVQSATQMNSSGVLRSLQAPFFSDEQRVETLFLATLSRQPDDAERQTILDYVLSEDGDEDRNQRLTDVLWALLNSAEFTLNH